MRIIDIKLFPRLLWLIPEFLSVAGESLSTFGYYSKRDTSVVQNHIATLVGLEDSKPVAYGHLDHDGETVWLGICVAAKCTGRGLGAEMMKALVNTAEAQGISEVVLGVHHFNTAARELYERFNFVPEGDIAGRPDLVRMVRRRTQVADTVGSLVDKLATINNKLFISQDVLYEIRRMSFDDFKKHYIHDPEGAHKLWDILKKTCDLNFQRSQLVAEVDKKLVEMIKAAVEGSSLDGEVQLPHKTY